jgi:hypothetical protein
MNSYLSKIEAERIVLQTVNQRFPAQPLHGLSSGAIATWAADTGAVVPESIVVELKAIGEIVGAMCERSGERADSVERIRLSNVRRVVGAFRSRHCE